MKLTVGTAVVISLKNEKIPQTFGQLPHSRVIARLRKFFFQRKKMATRSASSFACFRDTYDSPSEDSDEILSALAPGFKLPFDVMEAIKSILIDHGCSYQDPSENRGYRRTPPRKFEEDLLKKMDSLFFWGSHLWGTAHGSSDYDFVLLVDGLCGPLSLPNPENPTHNKKWNVFSGLFEGHSIDIAVYDVEHFKKLLQSNVIWALVFPFLPSQAVICQKRLLEFELDKRLLFFETLMSVSHYRLLMKRHFDNHFYFKAYKRGLYILQHLSFAIQLLNFGQISDLRFNSELYFEKVTSEDMATLAKTEKELSPYERGKQKIFTWEELMLWFEPQFNQLEKKLFELCEDIPFERDFNKMKEWCYANKSPVIPFKDRKNEIIPDKTPIDDLFERALLSGNVALVFNALREGGNPLAFNEYGNVFETCIIEYKQNPEDYREIFQLLLLDGRGDIFWRERPGTIEYCCGVGRRGLAEGSLFFHGLVAFIEKKDYELFDMFLTYAEKTCPEEFPGIFDPQRRFEKPVFLEALQKTMSGGGKRSTDLELPSPFVYRLLMYNILNLIHRPNLGTFEIDIDQNMDIKNVSDPFQYLTDPIWEKPLPKAEKDRIGSPRRRSVSPPPRIVQGDFPALGGRQVVPAEAPAMDFSKTPPEVCILSFPPIFFLVPKLIFDYGWPKNIPPHSDSSSKPFFKKVILPNNQTF